MPRMVSKKVEKTSLIPEDKVMEFDNTKIENNPYGVQYSKVPSLPSLYIPYSEKPNIYVRRLNTIECKRLSEACQEEESEFEEVLESIFSDDVIKGIDYLDLVVRDRFFIIIYVLIITYNDNRIGIPYECPSCSESNIHHLSIEQLDISDINPETIRDGSMTYSPTTVRNKRLIEQFISEQEEDLNLDEEMIYVCKNLKIGEETHPVKIYNILAQDVVEFLKAKDFVSSNEFGLIPEVRTNCKKCGGVARLGLNFQFEFFLQTFAR